MNKKQKIAAVIGLIALAVAIISFSMALYLGGTEKVSISNNDHTYTFTTSRNNSEVITSDEGVMEVIGATDDFSALQIENYNGDDIVVIIPAQVDDRTGKNNKQCSKLGISSLKFEFSVTALENVIEVCTGPLTMARFEDPNTQKWHNLTFFDPVDKAKVSRLTIREVLETLVITPN